MLLTSGNELLPKFSASRATTYSAQENRSVFLCAKQSVGAELQVESRLGGGLNWRLQAAMLLQFYYPPVHRYSRNSTSLHVQQKSNNFSYAWS